jgi:hypothetical protein
MRWKPSRKEIQDWITEKEDKFMHMRDQEPADQPQTLERQVHLYKFT